MYVMNLCIRYVPRNHYKTVVSEKLALLSPNLFVQSAPYKFYIIYQNNEFWKLVPKSQLYVMVIRNIREFHSIYWYQI